MHLGMPECHKLFLGHCDLDLCPSFQELLCPEHICYIMWCRNPKFGVVIPLGMAEWCIPFWVTLTLTLTFGLISRFFLLYYSYLSSNVSYARPIPLGAFVTCLWHFLLFPHFPGDSNTTDDKDLSAEKLSRYDENISCDCLHQPKQQYSKTCLKRPHKNRPQIGFGLSLYAGQKYCRMLQESILQYFWLALSYHLSLRPWFCLFLSGCFRQVLL